MKRLLLLSLFILGLAACGNKNAAPETNAPAAAASAAPAAPLLEISRNTITEIHLVSDASQSYCLYYPSSAPAPMQCAVIVFLDPHGSGRIPVQKYCRLANRFGIALVGSNNSKNGLSPTASEQFTNNIINDLTDRIGYKGQHICLAGFSGGAKVALATASNNANITNAIYAGASIAIAPGHPLHLLGFAGTEDMNYTDLLAFAQTHPESPMVEYRGKHEWPDTSIYRKAFYWVRFEEMRNTPGMRDTALVRAFRKETDLATASAEKKNDLLLTYQQSQIAQVFLARLSDVSAYQIKMERIAAMPAYTLQIKTKSDNLQKEAQEKQMLVAAFQKENGDWWGKVISHYQASTLPSDKRLLGFISLACYSYTGQMLAQHNLPNAAYILHIYELADPDNTDQLYYHAVLAAMQNDEDASRKYLTKAADKGFNDWAKVRSDPAFSQWRGNERFSQWISSREKGAR